MPGNLKKMTQSQKKICGCDICIDGGAMHTVLSGWRRERVRFYDQFVADLRDQDDEENAAQDPRRATL